MAVRPAQTAARPTRPTPRKVGPFAALSGKLLVLTSVAAAACFGYLVYGIVSKQLLYYPYLPPGDALLSQAQRAHMAAQVASTCHYLAIALVLAGLAAVGRYYYEHGAAGIFVVVGAALYFGFPYLLGAALQQFHLNPNALTKLMVVSITDTAKGVLAAAVVWLVVLNIVHLIRRPRDRWAAVTVKTERARPRGSLMRQCWELSHCSNNTRSVCACYRGRQSCWKRGNGCFCDSSMFDRMTDGVGTWVTVETNEQHTRALGLRRMGKKACKVCPVYEEHQYYKYRAICWIAYPVAAGLIAVGFPMLGSFFSNSITKLDRFVAGLSLLGDKPGSELFDTAAGAPVHWFIMGCLALLTVGYLLQFIEYLIFEKKL